MEFKLKKFQNALNVTRLANIHYFEFTEQYHTDNDRHEFRELVYVDNGSIYVSAEGYSGRLDKNQLIIHKSLEQHSLYCEAQTPPDVIIIGFECDCPELDRFSCTPATLPPEQVRALTEVIKEGRTVFLPPYDVPNLKDMKKRTDFPFGADQMIKLRLEIFLIGLIRSVTVSPDRKDGGAEDGKMREIHDYIENNFYKNITLDELCFIFNTNKTTLCGHFKRVYGTTVIDYVNECRVKKAKVYLRAGDRNVTQIASALGFASIHYFSRIFKKYEHMSPTEYSMTIKSKLGI
ncbi:MAG: helix-turn-helix transcriptional regulator [Clostridia bacterium]|nr:helix-turn-helix transcriptional regulator [Clostridia bacterium]